MKLRWLLLPYVAAWIAAAVYYPWEPVKPSPEWHGAEVKPEDPAEMLPALDEEPPL